MQSPLFALRRRGFKWFSVATLAAMLLILFNRPVAVADGIWQIYSAEGCYNVASFGVGMFGTGEGTLTVDVPGPVVDAFIEWVGVDDTTPLSPPDPLIATSVLTISNGVTARDVIGIQVPGEAGVATTPEPNWYAWYADIGPNGARLITEPGLTTLQISGWTNPNPRTNGATVSIIYSTGECETPRNVQLKAGVDWYFWASPGETFTDLLIYEYEASPEPRVATVHLAHAGTQDPQAVCRGGAAWMVAGTGEPPDPDHNIVAMDPLSGAGFGINGGVEIIEHPFTGPTLPCSPSINPVPEFPYEEGHPYPGGAATAPYRALGMWPPEGGHIGPQWGILLVDILIPANTNWIAFQLESQANQEGESGSWAGGLAFVLPAPQFVVLKTNDADGNGQFSDVEQAPAGDATVTFRVVMKNTSTRPLTIQNIIDDIHGANLDLTTATEWSPSCAEILNTVLPPTEEIACYFDGTIDLPTGGSETNTVLVEAVDPGGIPVSEIDRSTVIFTPRPVGPAVQVEKTLNLVGDAEDGIVTVGQEMSFTMRVTNVGTTTLAVVPLEDVYDPTYLEFLSASPPPDDLTTPGSLRWNDLTGDGVLEPQAEISVTVTFRALKSTNALPNRQTINTAIVAGATDVNQQIAPTAQDNAPVRITAPAVTVVKTVSDPADGVVKPNELVTFTITISNTGDTVLDIIPVRDVYDHNDLEFVNTSLVMPPQISEGELFWSDVTPELGDIGPGQSASFTITFRFINPDVVTTTNRVILGDVIDEHGDFAGKPEGEDDASTITQDPTVIVLLSFTAAATQEGMEIRWVTGAEINTLGFHLWRSTDSTFGNAERITQQLVLSTGGVSTGAAYSYVDRNVDSGVNYRYWLQEVEIGGTTALHGPITGYGSEGTIPDQNGSRFYLPLINR
jgi:hypothetical protein